MNLITLLAPPGSNSTWDDLEELLSEHFKLILSQKKAKRFIEFLNSPFLVKQPEKLLILFNYLYVRVAAGKACNIQLLSLNKRIFPTDGPVISKRKLSNVMRRTCTEIIRFLAYLRLDENPEELARLSTHSLQHRGVPVLYQRSQQAWETDAEQLPAGTHGAYHRWAAKHAGYYSLDIEKPFFDQKKFEHIWANLNNFLELHRRLYGLEATRSERTEDLIANLTTLLPNYEESLLAYLYQRITALDMEMDTDLAAFRQIKLLFLRHSVTFSKHHQIALVMGLQNHLNKLIVFHKNNLDQTRREIAFWPHYLLRTKAYLIVPYISTSVFNNSFYRALISNNLYLAQRLLNEVVPLLSVQEQPKVLAESEIAILFFRGKHKKVINSIADFYSQFKSRNVPKNFETMLRLHSFHIRSLLFRLAKDQLNDELERDALRAIQALAQFIWRNKDYLGQLGYVKRVKRFRKLCRMVLSHIKKSNFDKSITTIRAFAEADKPLHARDWFLAFIPKLER